MPCVRSESPTSPLPELGPTRTTLRTASGRGRVASTRASSSTKVEVEKRRNSGRREFGGTVSSVRLGIPLPPPPIRLELGKTRCSWITVSSEPLYTAFHDEECGVPVHDDHKLFELLTMSQALAELTWPVILSKREEFRKMIHGFNNESFAEFTEKKTNQLVKSNGNMLLSEQKIRAATKNAKQMQKVAHQFGSFSNYCWSFVNHRPIANSFRNARQVPIKTPKSEAISKDLMRRAFQCVGPTTIYSFMQAAGIVNDHLPCSFRFQACTQLRPNEKNVSAEQALAERRLSSSSSEDSGIREV